MCKPSSARARNGGFSLLELTCALFVVTVAGFGSIQLYSIGMSKIVMMREYDVATVTLRNEVERLRALPFASIADGMAVSPPSAALETLHEPVLAVKASERAPGLREVAVTLTWESRGGRSITRELTTLIADKGAEGQP
jgi:hypothetical protein